MQCPIGGTLSGRLGGFAAIWFVLGATQAIADVRNLYTVEGVPVDERAADELTAKSQGIEKAQQEALQGLIEKITLRDNYDQLPEVDQKTVQQTIRDYAVANEKFGGWTVSRDTHGSLQTSDSKGAADAE